MYIGYVGVEGFILHVTQSEATKCMVLQLTIGIKCFNGFTRPVPTAACVCTMSEQSLFTVGLVMSFQQNSLVFK